MRAIFVCVFQLFLINNLMQSLCVLIFISNTEVRQYPHSNISIFCPIASFNCIIHVYSVSKNQYLFYGTWYLIILMLYVTHCCIREGRKVLRNQQKNQIRNSRKLRNLLLHHLKICLAG